VIAERVLARLTALSEDLRPPVFALRQALASIVQKVVVDLQTKQVEVVLTLPAWAISRREVRKRCVSKELQRHQLPTRRISG